MKFHHMATVESPLCEENPPQPLIRDIALYNSIRSLSGSIEGAETVLNPEQYLAGQIVPTMSSYPKP